MAEKIKAVFSGKKITSNSLAAMALCNQSRFGELVEGKVSYSLAEAFYLMQKGRLDLSLGGKKLDSDGFLKKAEKLERNFMTKYLVFADLRSKGYVVKTALKFGAEFRVYGKGIKPGQDHAKWIVFPVDEGSKIAWSELAAKNRVAHSTKKSLLIAVVDDEGQVTYYESNWIKP